MGSHEYVLTTKKLMIALRRIITHFISSMTFWMKLPVTNYIVLGMAIMVITRSKLQRKTSWKQHSPLHGVHLPIWWCLLGYVMPMELFKGSWTRCWNHTLDFLFKCSWMTFECMGVGRWIFAIWNDCSIDWWWRMLLWILKNVILDAWKESYLATLFHKMGFA